jgi:hypothetical protein
MQQLGEGIFKQPATQAEVVFFLLYIASSVGRSQGKNMKEQIACWVNCGLEIMMIPQSCHCSCIL